MQNWMTQKIILKICKGNFLCPNPHKDPSLPSMFLVFWWHLKVRKKEGTSSSLHEERQRCTGTDTSCSTRPVTTIRLPEHPRRASAAGRNTRDAPPPPDREQCLLESRNRQDKDKLGKVCPNCQTYQRKAGFILALF